MRACCTWSVCFCVYGCLYVCLSVVSLQYEDIPSVILSSEDRMLVIIYYVNFIDGLCVMYKQDLIL